MQLGMICKITVQHLCHK